MKIGFIGTGNMANAIISGITDAGYVKPEDINLYDRTLEVAKAKAEELGANAVETATDLVAASDYILLGVKPHIIPVVVDEIKDALTDNDKVLISIAAGTSTDSILETVGSANEKQAIVRVMPNMNVMVGEGASAVTGNKYATDEQVEFVLNMFQTIGKAWALDENYFSAFTAISGSMPAHVFLFIDSIARAGVKHGLPKAMADEIATQAVLGSAKTLENTDDSAWTMVDKVSSPGGTTVAGLLELIDEGFISDVVAGVDATVAKDIALGKKK
ncbi:pyrroline-5-carboxylate reductase [Weissella uvarum]|uniref:pyrroline-5-carboxylate reductase n=1 Tax=Weissella uvarum TaxID=1479233 RepID=UPI001961D0B3|nr:pyrroline-5-carboxylate reductase [Weissella uvarum]MBM7617811.1 pyrroline-5-carboxylate reductase [Weissella uvarum]MCM0595810.1 pyrroline-5-carboxylate reductase [Weissella uvarum]